MSEPSLTDLARASPAGLARRVDGASFRYPPHLRVLNDALMDVAAGECDRLAVFMPPRHGKSTLASRTFPAWVAGSIPDTRLLLASYESDFAASWGHAARELLMTYGPEVFGTALSGDYRARNAWTATNGSSVVTSGVGGAFTGRGADIFLVDDPVKNAEAALSSTYRRKAWAWYQSTAYTRLEPGGCIILIMTRWHEDDLAGRILAETAEEGWRVLSFPALAHEDDPLGREPGEALWPERYDVDDLARIKRNIGTFWWSALYDQTPSPPEGNIFRRDWFRYWTRLPPKLEQLQSWDMTFKATTDGSYVVGQVWGRSGADKFLLDQIRARMSYTETLDAVARLTDRWPDAHVKLIEDAANGPAVMSMLRRSIRGIVGVTPQGSKEARASAVSPDVEGGNVWLPDPSMPGYAWVRDFVAEWTTFPRAATDDQVDAGTQALLRWAGAGSISYGWTAR